MNGNRDREEHLDRSFDGANAQINQQVDRKEEITSVPKENVFDAAEQVEGDPER